MQLGLFDNEVKQSAWTTKPSHGKFSYPLSIDVYELESILMLNEKPYVYVFKGGHRVTDSVFEDLIDLSTGIQNYLKPASESGNLPM